MDELWRGIPGLEGHEVSNIGRVRSYIWRNKRLNEPILRKQTKSRSGYLLVSFVGVVRPVHILVALAFIGPQPRDANNRIVVNHIDGIKTNNSVQNLEYVTARENSQHAANLGLIGLYPKYLSPEMGKPPNWRAWTRSLHTSETVQATPSTEIDPKYPKALSAKELAALCSVDRRSIIRRCKLPKTNRSYIRGCQFGKLWRISAIESARVVKEALAIAAYRAEEETK